MCVYLRHLSSSAYETLRDSVGGEGGLLCHHSEPYEIKHTTCQLSLAFLWPVTITSYWRQPTSVSAKKYVALTLNEMHIKEDLVFVMISFALHSGSYNFLGLLVGFINLGETNDHPTHVVFMVHGLFTKLQFPYTQFFCASVSKIGFHSADCHC